MLLQLCLVCLAEVHGVVTDAQTGEHLARVTVELAEGHGQVLTDADGQFEFKDLAPGSYTLKAATVGYRLLQQSLELSAGEVRDFELVLSPDNFRRTEKVEVRADLFDLTPTPTGPGPTAFSIGGNEAKNLASVLADDPLRAVHSLPGIRANDDFESRFSLHGAPYERVGVYLDGVLLHQPFHTVVGEGPSGSMAVFNADTVATISVESEGYGPEYGGRTAGVVDVRTREGSRSRNNFRLSAGAAGGGALAEGPLGSNGRGSWLVSVRKSYLQYLLQSSFDQPMAFGFMDTQVQLSYDLSRHHTAKVQVLDGTSHFDRTKWRDQLGLNASMLADYRMTLSGASWAYTPGSRLLVRSNVSFLREEFRDVNPGGQTLARGVYGEWTGGASATWTWSRRATLEAGTSLRRVRGFGFSDWFADPTTWTRVEGNRGRMLLGSGYGRQAWNVTSRLQVSVGARWDHLKENNTTTFSPQASLSILPWRSGRLQFSWGQYAQFPDVQELYSIYGNRRLLPARSTHFVAAFEQRLGPDARLRVQAYQRNDRDLLFRPTLEARIVGDAVQGDDFQAPLLNSLRGYAKGLEITLQRRTANRLSGWLSYSLGYSRMRDGITGVHFYSDYDQRHTVSAFGSYRIRPSVNLSAKWSYGSGLPLTGFFTLRNRDYYLAAERNTTRMDPYARADLRVNKSKVFDRWKMIVYGEVVNLLNRHNLRFDSYNGFSPDSKANLSLSRTFPVLPSAGLMLEF